MDPFAILAVAFVSSAAFYLLGKLVGRQARMQRAQDLASRLAPGYEQSAGRRRVGRGGRRVYMCACVAEQIIITTMHPQHHNHHHHHHDHHVHHYHDHHVQNTSGTSTSTSLRPICRLSWRGENDAAIRVAHHFCGPAVHVIMSARSRHVYYGEIL